MPKIPSERVGFCESCGAAIPWGTRFCPTCRSAPSAGPPAPGTETEARFLYRAIPFTAMATGSKSMTALAEAATTQLQSLLSRLDLEG